MMKATNINWLDRILETTVVVIGAYDSGVVPPTLIPYYQKERGFKSFKLHCT
jgi:hypothetical protein